MAEKDGITELAKMLKEREPKPTLSMTTGIVLSPPPTPKIRLNDVIVLKKEQLIFAASVLDGYGRKLKFLDADWGLTSTVSDGGRDASPHNHTVNLAAEDTPVEWTDTLIEGDEVILMPVVDGQLYYVLDKAVRFE